MRSYLAEHFFKISKNLEFYTFNYQIEITVLVGKETTSITQLRYNSLVTTQYSVQKDI